MAAVFYLPHHYMPNKAKREVWRAGGHITREQMGKGGCAENWIYQTWNALNLSGNPAALVEEMPETGVVICLSGTLHPGFKPARGCYVADVVADGLPHPAAHLHIVQNSRHTKFLPFSRFMPHWPQPNLLPRDKARGEKFEKVCFFGDPENLAPELRSAAWQQKMREKTGADFEIRWHQQWHDYSDVDAVVAIRDFAGARHIHKPATKLYNAWLAGVPFVGGTDSAYRSEGRAGVDHLVARSPDEVIRQLMRLRDEQGFRARIADAGTEKARDHTCKAVLRNWHQLTTEELPRRAAAWNRKSQAYRSALTAANRMCCYLDRMLMRRHVRP